MKCRRRTESRGCYIELSPLSLPTHLLSFCWLFHMAAVGQAADLQRGCESHSTSCIPPIFQHQHLLRHDLVSIPAPQENNQWSPQCQIRGSRRCSLLLLCRTGGMAEGSLGGRKCLGPEPCLSKGPDLCLSMAMAAEQGQAARARC